MSTSLMEGTSFTVFEVCVDSAESALAAQSAGADRIELCEALVIGGVTPSLGKIRCVLRTLAEDASLHHHHHHHLETRRRQPITVHVLVRPRGGDFCYSNAEIEIMLMDIASIKSIGRYEDRTNSLSVSGVVIGALTASGEVDEDLTARLISAARPEMTVTFHRAIDAARDTMEAFKVCQRLRVDRVLTSGRASTALLGVDLIRQMVEESKKGEKENKWSVIVLAGGGVNKDNAADIIAASGVTELHGSARVYINGRMLYRPPDDQIIYMGGEQRLIPSTEFGLKQATVESVTEILKNIR